MKFRMKPVVIEAMQWDGTKSGKNKITDKFPMITTTSQSGSLYKNEMTGWSILTLEGSMKVRKNDWIIKGIEGEFYPCKPDVFEMTYDYVDEEYESIVQKYCELLNNDKWDTVEFQDIQNCLIVYPQSVYQPELIKGAIDLRIRQWKRNQHQ